MYKHLFFDLDHTLWDFETNSKSALNSLYEDYLGSLSASFERFHETYRDVNSLFWAQYRVGRVKKEELRIGRFRETLLRFGYEDEQLSQSLADGYVERSPYQTALFPNAITTLEDLKEKGYDMHIITNGFEEVQHIKIKESGLLPFFSEIITSEQVDVRKPHPLIFKHAVDKARSKKSESVMIGDNLIADILGARDFGMDQVFFNPETSAHDEQPTYEISDLSQLSEIL